jgi:hypothetical protein
VEVCKCCVWGSESGFMLVFGFCVHAEVSKS